MMEPGILNYAEAVALLFIALLIVVGIIMHSWKRSKRNDQFGEPMGD
jgi:hypothetical protein